MRLAVLGGALLVVGLIAVALGVLPVADAVAVAARTWPVLLFVVAITVVTELAASAGVFARLAELAARAGRGRALLLWAFVVVLAILATVFLSLDTTAVLLTPLVVLTARHCGLDPIPFALTTVWLANTGSLLLPVSNLTNLLAVSALGDPGPLEFAARLALPALVAILIPLVVLVIVFRRSLAERYPRPTASARADDPVLFRAAVVTLAILLPLLVTGLPVWLPASVAAVVLAIFFLVRRRSELRLGLVPVPIVLFAAGLFLAMAALHATGALDVVSAALGSGGGPGDLVRVAASGAVAANLVNNLPAYLALEPLAHSADRLAALLVGVNVGPLITPWASLATLLWHARLTALGVTISWRRFIALGLVVVPPTVALAALAIR